MSSLSDTLDVLRPLLPPDLVSADAFGRARAAVQHLRSEITDCIYFECRLHDRSPGVDLVIKVYKEQAALAAPLEGGAGVAGYENPAWRRRAALCRQWSTPGSLLHEFVQHIWLEFDVDGTDAEPHGTAPGVFCRLRRRDPEADSVNQYHRRVIAVAEALTGRPASTAVRDCLFRSVARLPAEAEFPYIGFMAGRREPILRVCLAGLPPAGTVEYIGATAGVTGHAVTEVVNQATVPNLSHGPPYVPMLHLDLDERRGFLPRIGTERTFRSVNRYSGPSECAEHVLLHMLTERNLCTPKKRAALLTWPGRSAALLPDDLGWSMVVRGIGHVKFIQDPDAGMEAKGYLFAKLRRHRDRRRT